MDVTGSPSPDIFDRDEFGPMSNKAEMSDIEAVVERDRAAM